MSLRKSATAAKESVSCLASDMSDDLRNVLSLPIESPMFRARNKRLADDKAKQQRRGSLFDYMKPSSGKAQLMTNMGDAFDLKGMMYLKGSYKQVTKTSFKIGIAINVEKNGVPRMLNVAVKITLDSADKYQAQVVPAESLMKQFIFNAEAKSWLDKQLPFQFADVELSKMDAVKLTQAIISALKQYYM